MTDTKMRLFRQDKLWRDNMIERAEAQGSRLHWRRLDDAQYDEQLRLKLIEEVHEAVSAQSQKELVSELADVMEVIDAFAALHGFTRADVLAAQERKREDRGGFYERRFVEIAEHPVGSYLERYCLDAPDKYPEVVL